MAIIQDNLHLLAPPVQNWRILLEQSFTACMFLLIATSKIGLEEMLEFSSVVLPALASTIVNEWGKSSLNLL